MEESFVTTAVAERVLRFLERRDNRSAIIVGPPGAGKTTLVQFLSERLKQNGCVVGFVSGASDSSVDELIYSISRALDFDEASLPSAVRGYQGSLRLRPQFEHLRERIEPTRPVFLFIDAIDQFPESSSLTALIEGLVEDSHGLLRLVLTSRPNAVSARLQRNRLVEIFELVGLSLSESTSFLQAKLGSTINAETLSALVRVANGNPLILQLLAGSIKLLGSKSVSDLEQLSSGGIVARVLSQTLDIQSENARRILVALAVFTSAAIEQLEQATGLATVGLREALDGLLKNGLVTLNSGVVEFSHAVLRERVVGTLLIDKEIVPAELSFGDEAAERDEFLPAHFVPPADQDQIMTGTKTIVLGDRGAGKSAIFRSLEGFQIAGRDARADGHKNIIVALSKDPSAFIQRFSVQDSGVSSADQFKALWLFFASVLAARDVHPQVKLSKNDRLYSKEAWNLLRQVGWSKEIKGEGSLHRLGVRVKSVLPQKIAFAVGPVKIEPEWLRGNARGGSNSAMEIGDFIKHTDSILVRNELRLLVVVDQIDELYKYDRKRQEAMVQGIFLAESHLSQTKAIRLVVLLRTDLFGVYDIQEKNKFVSRTVNLRWAWPELILQLLRRAYVNDVLRVVSLRLSKEGLTRDTSELHLRCLFPEKVEGALTTEWLRKSLRNGKSEIAPRQVVLFLNFLKSRAPLGRVHLPIFTESELIRAVVDVSESAFQEVVTDFRVAVAFVRNCRAAKLSFFELAAVEKLFDLAEGPIAVQVELLERLGFVERVVTEEGDKQVVRFRIPELFTRCWN